MKLLTPRNPWNYETVDTTKPMKPRNTWNYETTDTTRPMKPWLHDTIIIWHRHWHILISINSCTVTPSNNLHPNTSFPDILKWLAGLYQPWNTVFRYILFFFKVISGTQYQSFYKSLAILVSYEDKRGYSGIPLPLTLTPSMRAGPENMEGWSSWSENNDSLPIQIPRCDTHFSQFKEERLIQLGYFFFWRETEISFITKTLAADGLRSIATWP